MYYAETTEIEDFDRWAEGMRMSDEEFYREARPGFDSTENMHAIVERDGRERVLKRMLRYNYTPRHAKPLY